MLTPDLNSVNLRSEGGGGEKHTRGAGELKHQTSNIKRSTFLTDNTIPVTPQRGGETDKTTKAPPPTPHPTESLNTGSQHSEWGHYTNIGDGDAAFCANFLLFIFTSNFIRLRFQFKQINLAILQGGYAPSCGPPPTSSILVRLSYSLHC